MSTSQQTPLTTDPGRHIHLSGRIYLGRGRVVNDAWILNNRVTFIRPSHVPEPLRINGYGIPGLVDMHCHIGLDADGAVSLETAADQAEATLRSGVTLLRDAGSPTDTRTLSQRIDLPRMVRAGAHLARPKRYLRNFSRELASVDDLPTAVREEASRGTGWVKIVADWIDRDLGEKADLTTLWPREVLIEAVASAHAESARVTVHAFSTEAIDDALAAGVDAIEHGTGLTDAQIAEVVERGIPVTPTMLQVNEFEDIARQADGKYPLFAARMRRLHAQRYEHVKKLHDAGVTLFVGSDAGGTVSHGAMAAECAELVAAGIPPAQVVAMASWRARDYLGQGNVIEGSQADFVMYDRDPTTHIDVLAEPKAVILRGRILD